jgi:hypothetical protein
MFRVQLFFLLAFAVFGQQASANRFMMVMCDTSYATPSVWQACPKLAKSVVEKGVSTSEGNWWLYIAPSGGVGGSLPNAAVQFHGELVVDSQPIMMDSVQAYPLDASAGDSIVGWMVELPRMYRRVMKTLPKNPAAPPRRQTPPAPRPTTPPPAWPPIKASTADRPSRVGSAVILFFFNLLISSKTKISQKYWISSIFD